MENKDRRLTIGDIVLNPAFDKNCRVRIVDAADPGIQLWACYGRNLFPDDIFNRKLAGITVQDNCLILEAERERV